ncbi:acyl-CoA-like ligand-binding transcription factor [Actinoalloteichus hymeniacidonis]|uniref:Transcriptional regulator, TetR family n=1 Tax=Actinoalloteichus hymeniacidonis TaxID=340345 RepID=A0AAC9HL89_9PSEU|nr:TetR family transcriptional regulator [Actinoalloteichus hymeniacidonis]AOS60965.1 transcriptional regulator, TetR family [Actinoalloteichus hymeniacidonis]MBB5911035.1 AcrR family transcriptional regulator [Actinoalloteichus hymeniacidonis]
METGEGGLRERKKRATRRALSEAVIRLSLEHGFDNVTVEDIASAANVSERTFRNYFANKAEAVVAMHVERGRQIADVLRERPADEPLWDALVNAVIEQFEHQPAPEQPADDRHTSARQRLLAEPAVQHEVFRAHATAQRELTEAIAARTGTDATADLYPQVVASVVGAGLNTAITHWTRDPERSLVPLLREIFAQIRAGLPDPR